MNCFGKEQNHTDGKHGYFASTKCKRMTIIWLFANEYRYFPSIRVLYTYCCGKYILIIRVIPIEVSVVDIAGKYWFAFVIDYLHHLMNVHILHQRKDSQCYHIHNYHHRLPHYFLHKEGIWTWYYHSHRTNYCCNMTNIIITPCSCTYWYKACVGFIILLIEQTINCVLHYLSLKQE